LEEWIEELTTSHNTIAAFDVQGTGLAAVQDDILATLQRVRQQAELFSIVR
jgi:hypothetical protein